MTRASRSPPGEPEGRQPPSPMVPIDSAERSRRSGLRGVHHAERRADTEVPPVLEGKVLPSGCTSPRNVRIAWIPEGVRNDRIVLRTRLAIRSRHPHGLPYEAMGKPICRVTTWLSRGLDRSSSLFDPMLLSPAHRHPGVRVVANDHRQWGYHRTPTANRRPCRRLAHVQLTERPCGRPAAGSFVPAHRAEGFPLTRLYRP